MNNRVNVKFVPIRQAAVALGVPLAWLKREVESGRIPAVRAGQRWLVHVEQAQRVLTERAVDGGAL